jgi:hypothetical protein
MINGVKNFFWHSETILWARLQVLFGVVWTVLSVTDLSPLLDAKYMTYWLIVSGVITELLRRKGTTGQTVMVADTTAKTGLTQPVSFLSSPPPGP